MKKVKSSLPTEVEIDILSRLPIKSLVRFMSVSKPWFDLFTRDSNFQSTIAKATPNHIILAKVGTSRRTKILCEEDFLDAVIKVKSIPSPAMRSHEVIGTCNGILCLKHCYYDDGIYLWNPTTGSDCFIPSSRVYDYHANFGFGFHQGTNQYKLVRIADSPRARTFSEVRVYTVGGGGRWRVLDRIPYILCDKVKGEQSNVIVNGALHWLSVRPHKIICFDLETEVIREMPFPANMTPYLWELGGLLCSNRNNWNGYSLVIDIMVMKEYGDANSWTKVITVDASRGLEPVGYLRNENMIILKNKETLELYSSEGVLFKRIRSPMSGKYQAVNYLPSLVSPRVLNEAANRE